MLWFKLLYTIINVATSNSVGRVYVNINSLDPGSYMASVIYGGNEFYNAAIAMANVLIKNPST